MRQVYLLLMNFIVVVVLLSNIRLPKELDYQFKNEHFSTFKLFVYSFTKLNWDYGFFSSDKFGYLSSKLELYKEGHKEIRQMSHRDLVSQYNYIRITSLIPGFMTDSLNIEASTKSLALYLFNQYPEYDHVRIRIYNNNYSALEREDHFELFVAEQMIYDQTLCF